MKKSYPVEFVYQTLSLIIAVIVVHAVYVLVVRPKAEIALGEQRAMIELDPAAAQERSVWIIIRDFEQEACFVLMIWAVAIMTYKGVIAVKEHRLLETDLVPVSEGTRILPEDAREYARQIQSLPADEQRFLLPRALLAALHPISRDAKHPGRVDDGAWSL